MKIKTKKQLNLPQLIEYIVKNDLINKMFTSDSKSVEPGVIYVSATGAISTQLSVYGNELFTIEVEEEITEDTVIPKMLEKSFDAYQNVVLDIQVNQSINTVKENAKVLTLHIINDDDTHTLIWRDGGLVE